MSGKQFGNQRDAFSRVQDNILWQNEHGYNFGKHLEQDAAKRNPREHGADMDLEGIAQQDMPAMEGMKAHKAQGPEHDQTMSPTPRYTRQRARLLLQFPLSMNLVQQHVM